MMLTIVSNFSGKVDQHDKVRQAVLCKRQGLNSVVRYTSAVYDWLTVWILCHNKFHGLIIFSSHAYLAEIAMLC